MDAPQSQISEIHYKVSSILTLLQDLNLRELLEELDLTEEFSFANSVKNNLDKLLETHRVEERMESAQKVADKFEDYMKNIDRLNVLVNEFKGVVAMSRAALQEKKEDVEYLATEMKEVHIRMNDLEKRISARFDIFENNIKSYLVFAAKHLSDEEG